MFCVDFVGTLGMDFGLFVSPVLESMESSVRLFRGTAFCRLAHSCVEKYKL